jgi:hypothetical protein
MYIRRNSLENILHLPARDVKIGDEIIDHENKIYKIIEINLYKSECVGNIRTKSRKLIIDGIQSSCVSEDDAGYFGHLILLGSSMISENLPQKINQLGLYLINLKLKNLCS